MSQQQHQQNISWLQQFLENIWYKKGRGKWLLLPFSVLYCGLHAFVRWKQSRSQRPLAVPVIIVGNISIGGTGKTPVVIYLAQCLKNAGYKPGIITRGYGGKSTEWPQAVGKDSEASEVGDEPVLMAACTAVPIVAGPDRNANADELIAEYGCDVVISDDGLQHYRLKRDIEIVLIDAQRQLGNNCCLPAGPLRESANKLRHIDFAIFNGRNTSSLDTDYQIQSVFEMEVCGENLVPLNANTPELAITDIKDVVHAITGIGNPERFYSTLAGLGLNVEQHSFPDHHDFKLSELCFDDNRVVIMTEKDAVKCRGFALKNCYYLPIEVCLDNKFDQQLLDKLKALIRAKRKE